MYTPKPIDTAHIRLPKDLLKLTELLAENIHEVWAKQRISEGWTFGPARNDKKLHHPCLIPYKDLPEVEKEYDRHTALETIRTIIAFGYQIGLKPTQAQEGFVVDDEELHLALEQLKQPPPLRLRFLLRIWELHDSRHWRNYPEIYKLLGNHLMRIGEPLLAYDVLSEGLDASPRDIRIRQLIATSLNRSGAVLKANHILRQLHDEGNEDEETLGLLASTYKRLWQMDSNELNRQNHLNDAYFFYKKAYLLTKGYYSGINMATLALLMGDKETAQDVARQVFPICLDELTYINQHGGDPYWVQATLGEIALILGEFFEAEDWYSRAAAIAKGRFADLSSTRQQARKLTEFIFDDRNKLDHCFSIPPVAVFSGPIIDAPDRKSPRFPQALEHLVKEAIREKLKKLNIYIGYSAASFGADLLFAEALLEENGETHLVLPYSRQQYKNEMLAQTNRLEWGKRFDELTERATEVFEISNEKSNLGTISSLYSSLLLHGLACVKADQLETEVIPISVWDGQSDDVTDSTKTMIHHWQQHGYNVELINLEFLRKIKLQIETQPLSGAVISHPENQRGKIRALLFADAVKYSQLKENEIILFIEKFLGAIGELISRSTYAPIVKNTWGDGLFFVFEDVKDAGLFALDMCDLVNDTNWVEMGLPGTLNLRIALHAGPVIACTDPITGLNSYNGTHVSQAARIEPITPPGQVYASQAFAALALAQNVRDYNCRYVGQIPLAKEYGVFPMYHIVRRTV